MMNRCLRMLLLGSEVRTPLSVCSVVYCKGIRFHQENRPTAAHLLVVGERRLEVVAVQPSPRGGVLQPHMGPELDGRPARAVLALRAAQTSKVTGRFSGLAIVLM